MAESFFCGALISFCAYILGAIHGFREGRSAGRQELRVIDLSGSSFSHEKAGTHGP